MTYDEFRTVLVEVEAMLNSRPLGYVADDKPEILTPAHLLIGKRLTAPPPPPRKAAEKITGDRDVGKRWRARLKLMARFWNLWKKDYLLQLRTIHERRNSNSKIELGKGHVVILDDEKSGRQFWKTCVIDEVFKGRDGVVRSCLVRLPGGKVIKRPVQLLFPIEIECDL